MARSVVVVEDDRGLREQLVKILNSGAGIHCIGAYASAEEALRLNPAKGPDVVLMDIRLPGMSGIECVAQLRQRQISKAAAPDPKTSVFSKMIALAIDGERANFHRRKSARVLRALGTVDRTGSADQTDQREGIAGSEDGFHSRLAPA